MFRLRLGRQELNECFDNLCGLQAADLNSLSDALRQQLQGDTFCKFFLKKHRPLNIRQDASSSSVISSSKYGQLVTPPTSGTGAPAAPDQPSKSASEASSKSQTRVASAIEAVLRTVSECSPAESMPDFSLNADQQAAYGLPADIMASVLASPEAFPLVTALPEEQKLAPTVQTRPEMNKIKPKKRKAETAADNDTGPRPSKISKSKAPHETIENRTEPAENNIPKIRIKLPGGGSSSTSSGVVEIIGEMHCGDITNRPSKFVAEQNHLHNSKLGSGDDSITSNKPTQIASTTKNKVKLEGRVGKKVGSGGRIKSPDNLLRSKKSSFAKIPKVKKKTSNKTNDDSSASTKGSVSPSVEGQQQQCSNDLTAKIPTDTHSSSLNAINHDTTTTGTMATNVDERGGGPQNYADKLVDQTDNATQGNQNNPAEKSREWLLIDDADGNDEPTELSRNNELVSPASSCDTRSSLHENKDGDEHKRKLLKNIAKKLAARIGTSSKSCSSTTSAASSSPAATGARRPSQSITPENQDDTGTATSMMPVLKPIPIAGCARTSRDSSIDSPNLQSRRSSQTVLLDVNDGLELKHQRTRVHDCVRLYCEPCRRSAPSKPLRDSDNPKVGLYSAPYPDDLFANLSAKVTKTLYQYEARVGAADKGDDSVPRERGSPRFATRMGFKQFEVPSSYAKYDAKKVNADHGHTAAQTAALMARLIKLRASDLELQKYENMREVEHGYMSRTILHIFLQGNQALFGATTNSKMDTFSGRVTRVKMANNWASIRIKRKLGAAVHAVCRARPYTGVLYSTSSVPPTDGLPLPILPAVKLAQIRNGLAIGVGEDIVPKGLIDKDIARKIKVTHNERKKRRKAHHAASQANATASSTDNSPPSTAEKPGPMPSNPDVNMPLSSSNAAQQHYPVPGTSSSMQHNMQPPPPQPGLALVHEMITNIIGAHRGSGVDYSAPRPQHYAPEQYHPAARQHHGSGVDSAIDPFRTDHHGESSLHNIHRAPMAPACNDPRGAARQVNMAHPGDNTAFSNMLNRYGSASDQQQRLPPSNLLQRSTSFISGNNKSADANFAFYNKHNEPPQSNTYDTGARGTSTSSPNDWGPSQEPDHQPQMQQRHQTGGPSVRDLTGAGHHNFGANHPGTSLAMYGSASRFIHGSSHQSQYPAAAGPMPDRRCSADGYSAMQMNAAAAPGPHNMHRISPGFPPHNYNSQAGASNNTPNFEPYRSIPHQQQHPANNKPSVHSRLYYPPADKGGGPQFLHRSSVSPCSAESPPLPAGPAPSNSPPLPPDSYKKPVVTAPSADDDFTDYGEPEGEPIFMDLE